MIRGSLMAMPRQREVVWPAACSNQLQEQPPPGQRRPGLFEPRRFALERHAMRDPAKSFLGKCPRCSSYHSRIRTELLDYGNSPSAGAAQSVVARTRMYLCNGCAHLWSETVAEEQARTDGARGAT